MFLDFYGLREQPFGVTPDPRYLYLSQTHREALASLRYGFESDRGFLALIAKPGTGKTTLVLELLEQLKDSSRTLFLFQTQCDSRELFRYLLGGLGIETTGQDIVSMHEKLNEILAREMLAHRRFVLVIDEAQNLQDSVLETVRLLSDFETPAAKLIQILLVGQPQLAKKLASASLTQLRQRIAILARLEPLKPAETTCYIDHRLRAAGYAGGPLFTPGALDKIALASEGIPRNINNLCFTALSVGCASSQRRIDSAIVDEIVANLEISSSWQEPKPVRKEVPAPPPPAPQFLRPQKATHNFGRWAIGAVIGVAALAIVLGLRGLFPFHPTMGPSKAAQVGEALEGVQATVVPGDPGIQGQPTESNPPATLAPKERAALTATPGEGRHIEALTVVVEPNQTLRDICIKYLGRYDDQILEQVRELNPWLKNPDHIEAGQQVWLPKLLPAPGGAAAKARNQQGSQTPRRKAP